jgi:hypothetical protein
VVAQPVMVWKVLADDVYDYYGEHIEYMYWLFTRQYWVLFHFD